MFGLRRPSQPHTLVLAELQRARVGPVGPADKKARQQGARSKDGQMGARQVGARSNVPETLVEQDPAASINGAAGRGGRPEGGGSGGEKCGVGLTFRKDSRGYFTVLAINTEMLASDVGPQGVAVGDTLVHASGSDVKDLPHAALAKLILGPPQSSVQLGFVRRDGSSFVTNAIRSKPVGDAPASQAAALPATPAAPPASAGYAGGRSGICDVGLRLRAREDGGIVVEELLPGGPAAAAGHLIQPGDLLLQAEQRILTGMSLESVYHLLMGSAGSMCQVEVEKRGGGRQAVALVRVPRESFPGVPDPAEFKMALA